MTRSNEIRLTDLDAARLERSLIEQLRQSPEPAHGTAELEEQPTERRMTVTLVYPRDSDPERARVSVLTPVGRALIGARVGDTIKIVVPGNNEPRELRVVEMQYQPEANGRFDL